MIRFSRRTTLAALSAIALTACGGASSGNAQGGQDGSGGVALTDITLGSDDAPVTVVEYASWTCPACLDFHARIMPTVKADYIDTGKVRLVFREFPTAPANVTVAGFALARCVEDDAYYDMLDELFMRQDAILTLARQGGPVVEALKQIASNHGIEGDEAFQACLDDEGNRNAIRASIAAAEAKSVNATPTFFVNGELMDTNARVSTVTFTAVLDAALDETESE